MTTGRTAETTIENEIGTDDERLELASAIYELYSLGLIAEEVDTKGTPRFRPTGIQP
jgi:hypothetical protein